jgi:hypothetical protein
MPHIIVTADGSTGPREGAVMLRERISLSDLESGHFAAQLVERLGWAVEDAQQMERKTEVQEAEAVGVASGWDTAER